MKSGDWDHLVALAGKLRAAAAQAEGGARPGLREHNHRADRPLPVKRRNVVALDAQGRSRQRERVLELQERRVQPLLVVAGAHAEAHERVARVLLGKLQEVDDVSFVTYARTALPVALKELQELRGRT